MNASPYWNYGDLGPRFGISELPPRTEAERDADEARRVAFQASPKGLFLAALAELEEVPHAVVQQAAWAARSAYNRGFSSSARINSPAEMNHARKVLEPFVSYPACERALAALREIEAADLVEAA